MLIRPLVIFLLAPSLLFAILFAPAAFAFTTRAPHVLLFDMQSGQTLFEKRSGEKLFPASMTKVMTAYIVMEDLVAGKIKFEDQFNVSEKAWKAEGSRMFLEPNVKVSVIDLLRGLIVQSGNDAAIALAEGIAGSEEAFASRMTKVAQGFGATSTNFINASGLPHKNHYTTAQDLAIIGARAISDFLPYYQLYSERSFRHNNIEQFNRNRMLDRVEGVDGLKTGHTEKSGYGILASGTRNNRRLLLVIHGLDNEKDRAREAERLIEWGFGSWENQTFHQSGQPLADLPTSFAAEESATVTIDRDLIVSVPLGDGGGPKFKMVYQGPLTGGIKAGDEIGALVVMIGDVSIVRRLIAAEDVQEPGFFRSISLNVKNILASMF